MDAFFSTGLVSVTFRRLSVDEVIKAAIDAELTCIEWGGDIHVPHGNIKVAKVVAKKTRDHGLSIPCYGSYYRLGDSEKNGLSYEKVLESALALNTSLVRVWAGALPSAAVTPQYRAMIESEALRVANLSRQAGCRIAFEYHANTLTDTCASSMALLQAINSTAMILWQPTSTLTVDENASDLKNLLPWLSHIHAFHQSGSGRHALSEGREAWRKYFEVLKAGKPGRDILLEFVRDDAPSALKQDAAFLHSMLRDLTPKSLQNLEHKKTVCAI